MSRRIRLAVFVVGAAVLAWMFARQVGELPDFGQARHLYRDLAVGAALAHHTANVISSVNFDQRALDTLGEESILLASVVGVMSLLRPAAEEREFAPRAEQRPLEATRVVGYVLLPVTLAIGADVVVHGHITPGGGFQGGVVLATGLHLLYVSGNFRVLDRLRPVNAFDAGEVLGAVSFVLLGIAALGVAGSFLANVLPTGSLGSLFSAGTVPLFNIAVGIEVGCAMTVLLAQFLAQEITVGTSGEAESGRRSGAAQ